MRIRKFEAGSVQQAMAKVKAELGNDAVILHTRSFPGKLFGLFGKPRVEVTAAIEDQKPLYNGGRPVARDTFPPDPPVQPAPILASSPVLEPEAPVAPPGKASPAIQAAAHDFLSRIEELRNPPALFSKEEPSPEGSETTVAQPESRVTSELEAGRLETLEVRIDRLANTMGRLLSLGGPLGQMGVLAEVPNAWQPAMKRLLQSSLSEGLLSRVAGRLKAIPHPGEELETKVLSEVLTGFITTTEPISKPVSGQRVIALVGPTGVGKTTTLAKLASGLVVEPMGSTRVGLITVDTYRLAAEDQLRKYAEILNLDLQVVYGPEEMPEALSKCADADVVFVDTAGRSPRDEAQMAELKSFLDRVPDLEKFLVLSSTMDQRYIEEAVERFRPISIDSLIVTKLDETNNFAAALNIQQTCRLPISYLTTGQNVPEDIERVEAPHLAEEILKEVEQTKATKEETEPEFVDAVAEPVGV